MKAPGCDHALSRAKWLPQCASCGEELRYAKIAEKPHHLYGKAFMDGWTQGARGIQPKSPSKLKGLALKAYLNGWAKGWTARENADKSTPAPTRPHGSRF